MVNTELNLHRDIGFDSRGVRLPSKFMIQPFSGEAQEAVEKSCGRIVQGETPITSEEFNVFVEGMVNLTGGVKVDYIIANPYTHRSHLIGDPDSGRQFQFFLYKAGVAMYSGIVVQSEAMFPSLYTSSAIARGDLSPEITRKICQDSFTAYNRSLASTSPVQPGLSGSHG